VIVRVSRDAGSARLDVADTGIGMSPEVAARVYERFYQADPSRSSAAGGAGIGLSLVKWIVERHHGSIALETNPGRGSTFTVMIPGPRTDRRS
jgi:two-component system OmpR family sensor kinase